MMKYFLALPAVLRASLHLASASQHSFSVHDDLLAFPQYEVHFLEDYLTEEEAKSEVQAADHKTPPSDVDQYRPINSHDADDTKQDTQYEHEYMVLDDQRYLCSIPIVKKPDETSGGNDTLSKAEEEKELARAAERGWELLSSMRGNCVYFISGWWSYKFCYGQGVKQFHQLPPNRGVPIYPPVEDPTVEGYELGLYGAQNQKQEDETDDELTVKVTHMMWDMDSVDASEGESALDVSEGNRAKHARSGDGELVQRGESRYLVQRLGGGTRCDLTGKERRIEVQFHCNPQSTDRISLIKETSTCAYLMVIQTPRLCNDIAFLPPQKDFPNPISCSPIFTTEAEISTYQAELAALKSFDQEILSSPPQDHDNPTDSEEVEPPTVIGDIVLGAHAIVPRDLVLPESSIINPGGGKKETFIGTVTSSEGTTASEEEMKKLGLGDPKAVEKLRKEMERVAEGQRWKLDVVDGPRGREFRGVIIGDDEMEEQEGGKEGEREGQEAEGEGEGSKEEMYRDEL